MELSLDYPNPYVTKNIETKFDSPWIKVEECNVLNPAGKPTLYSKVLFKRIAVGVLTLDSDNQVYLVGQYRYPIDSYSWEIVEGGSEKGEDPLETAKRELAEEAGIRAKNWQKLLEMDLSNATTDETAVLYLARDISVGKPNPDEGEDLRLIKVPFDQLYQWVLEGKVRDALSVSAVLRVQQMLSQGEI